MPNIIPMQCHIERPREFVSAGTEYLAMVHDLDFISDTIQKSGIENVIMQYFVDRALMLNPKLQLNNKKLERIQREGLFILYAMVLRDYLGLTLRPFQLILASSPLFQTFCGINNYVGAKIPNFQKINSLENSLDEEILRKINSIFVKDTILDKSKLKDLDIKENFNLNTLLTDSTCIKANIHYPVDYVLFRDIIRTSMKKVKMIRDGGIKIRMPHEDWLSKMNANIVEMSLCSRKKDAKKNRKKIFRKMKKLFKQAMLHVKSHLTKFEKDWQNHDFSSLKAERIILTLKNMLEIKDEVVSLAHRRIIKEEKIPSNEKVLSIYDNDVYVINRNKDGHKVEFGNTLQFVEQLDGFIVDYDLLKDTSKGDHQCCKESLERIIKNFNPKEYPVMHMVGDRGYDAASLEKFVEDKNENHSCQINYDVLPKDPKKMRDKMKDPQFLKLQKRRSSTEAKVAHIKMITNNPMGQKGIRNRKTHMGIAILSHNLMKLARIHREQEAIASKVA